MMNCENCKYAHYIEVEDYFGSRGYEVECRALQEEMCDEMKEEVGYLLDD